MVSTRAHKGGYMVSRLIVDAEYYCMYYQVLSITMRSPNSRFYGISAHSLGGGGQPQSKAAVAAFQVGRGH